MGPACGVAVELMGNPSVLFLDEPTTGVLGFPPPGGWCHGRCKSQHRVPFSKGVPSLKNWQCGPFTLK